MPDDSTQSGLQHRWFAGCWQEAPQYSKDTLIDCLAQRIWRETRLSYSHYLSYTEDRTKKRYYHCTCDIKHHMMSVLFTKMCTHPCHGACHGSCKTCHGMMGLDYFLYPYQDSLHISSSLVFHFDLFYPFYQCHYNYPLDVTQTYQT
jgi:hypothetical protein